MDSNRNRGLDNSDKTESFYSIAQLLVGRWCWRRSERRVAGEPEVEFPARLPSSQHGFNTRPLLAPTALIEWVSCRDHSLSRALHVNSIIEANSQLGAHLDTQVASPKFSL
jgi:hypothetical protein